MPGLILRFACQAARPVGVITIFSQFYFGAGQQILGVAQGDRGIASGLHFVSLRQQHPRLGQIFGLDRFKLQFAIYPGGFRRPAQRISLAAVLEHGDCIPEIGLGASPVPGGILSGIDRGRIRMRLDHRSHFLGRQIGN